VSNGHDDKDDAHEWSDAEWVARGGQIVDGGSIEDAPTAMLVAAYQAAPRGKGMKHYLAWLVNERGALQGCGCATCTEIRAHAVRWQRHLAAQDEQPPTGGGSTV